MKQKSAMPRLVTGVILLLLTASLHAANSVSNTVTHATFPTITEALAALADDGQTLVVAPGIYTEPELIIQYAVTLAGERDDTTIIQPSATPGTAASRVATVYIPAEFGVTLPVIFERLTLRHGNSASYGGAVLVQEGSALLRECVVSNNAASGTGGGLSCMSGAEASLTVEDSRITCNTSGSQGGGVFRGSCLRCIITANQATDGGGVAYSELADCMVSDNSAYSQGGGLFRSTATRCIVADNTALFGGGAFRTVLLNARMSGNSAGQSGGGLYQGAATNCSLVANAAATAGGGLWGASAANTLLYTNTAPSGADYDNASVLAYSRAEPLAPGTGNRSDPPRFRDFSAGDYTLLPNSSCIDAGLSSAAPEGPDLNGTARIQGASVDIGAYEQAPSLEVATPEFDPVDATSFADTLPVTITCTTENATIRYTLDGSDPTAASALYSGPVTLSATATLKARAFKDGHSDSAVASATYTKLARVGTPAFAPGTSSFTNSVDVTITCPTNGAAIRYTLDGSDPTLTNTLYTQTVTLTQTTTLKARAFKAGMSDSELAEAVYTRAFTWADAVDAPSLLFTSGGSAPWFIESETTHTGGAFAVQSGLITDRQSSWLETTASGAGTVSFWWKVSCEDDEFNDWDYVSVSIDGVEQARIDGEADWTKVSLTLGTGEHTIRWLYLKDRVSSEGQDCAWLDNVSWTPSGAETQNTPVPVPYDWLTSYALSEGGDYEAAALSDTDGDGYAAWQEYVAGTSPTNGLSVFQAAISFEEGATRITWAPDLGATRIYTVKGKALLDDEIWTTPTNAASRFFRVDVTMP